MADALETALALIAERRALDHVEVRTPAGVVFTLDHDTWEITIRRDGEIVGQHEARTCADDLEDDDERYQPGEVALVRDAVVATYHRAIEAHRELQRAIAELRAAGDARDEARRLVTEDDARLDALEAQRRKEERAQVERVRRRRRRSWRRMAVAAAIAIGAAVAWALFVESLRP
jgi:hypothetical protein